jgi:site-specific recombinase XerD
VHALLRQAHTSRDEERNYAILQALLQTGIRLSECAALTLGDITFGERNGTLRVRAGKGNKARSVPLKASAREALAAYLSLRLSSARSYLAQYPGDVVGLATLLGHSSLDTTRLYCQPEASQLAARVEQLDINAYSG